MAEVVGRCARISEDVLGLERELAERRGWTTRSDLEFCANDVSALNRRERAEAIDQLSKVRVPITLVRGGDIDLSSPYGRGSVAQQGEADTLEPLKRITADLNARKIPTPNGTPEQPGTWLPSTVRKLVLRRANIARRIHHRGRPDETETDPAWPPIVDRDKHERLLVLPNHVRQRRRARS